MEFVGSAVQLSHNDISIVASMLGVPVPVLNAVRTVETGGLRGFLPDNRPRILFEALHFHRYTTGKFTSSHPDVSSATWNKSLYTNGVGEYRRLERAVVLNREAALKSASWGLFQIMGGNHEACGFVDVESFVTAMCTNEYAHLLAFAEFIKTNKLVKFLQDQDWAKFARGYNGPGYTANAYDKKLERAYQSLLSPGTTTIVNINTNKGNPARLLSIGMSGSDVKALQNALRKFGYTTINPDGDFGRFTEIAVEAFQQSKSLEVDGVVGRTTRMALGLN